MMETAPPQDKRNQGRCSSAFTHCDIFRLRGSLIELIEELKLRKSAERDNEEKIRQLMNEKHELERNLDAARFARQAAEESHQQELTRAQQQYEDKLRTLEEEQKQFYVLKTCAEKEMKILKDESRTLQLAKYNLEKRVKELESKLTTQQQAADTQFRQLSGLESKVDAMKTHVRRLEGSQSRLDKNLEEASKMNRGLVHVNKHQQCIINQLRQDVDKLRHQLVLARAAQQKEPMDALKIAEQQEEIRHLKLQIETMESQIKSMERERKTCESNYGMCLKNLKDAQVLINKHLSDSEKYEQHIESLQTKEKDLQFQCEKLASQLEAANADLDAFGKTREEDHKMWTERMEGAKSEMWALQEELSRTRATLTSVEDQYRDTCEQLEKAVQRLKDAEDKMSVQREDQTSQTTSSFFATSPAECQTESNTSDASVQTSVATSSSSAQTSLLVHNRGSQTDVITTIACASQTYVAPLFAQAAQTDLSFAEPNPQEASFQRVWYGETKADRKELQTASTQTGGNYGQITGEYTEQPALGAVRPLGTVSGEGSVALSNSSSVGRETSAERSSSEKINSADVVTVDVASGDDVMELRVDSAHLVGVVSSAEQNDSKLSLPLDRPVETVDLSLSLDRILEIGLSNDRPVSRGLSKDTDSSSDSAAVAESHTAVSSSLAFGARKETTASSCGTGMAVSRDIILSPTETHGDCEPVHEEQIQTSDGLRVTRETSQHIVQTQGGESVELFFSQGLNSSGKAASTDIVSQVSKEHKEVIEKHSSVQSVQRLTSQNTTISIKANVNTSETESSKHSEATECSFPQTETKEILLSSLEVKKGFASFFSRTDVHTQNPTKATQSGLSKSAPGDIHLTCNNTETQKPNEPVSGPSLDLQQCPTTPINTRRSSSLSLVKPQPVEGRHVASQRAELTATSALSSPSASASSSTLMGFTSLAATTRMSPASSSGLDSIAGQCAQGKQPPAVVSKLSPCSGAPFSTFGGRSDQKTIAVAEVSPVRSRESVRLKQGRNNSPGTRTKTSPRSQGAFKFPTLQIKLTDCQREKKGQTKGILRGTQQSTSGKSVTFSTSLNQTLEIPPRQQPPLSTNRSISSLRPSSSTTSSNRRPSPSVTRSVTDGDEPLFDDSDDDSSVGVDTVKREIDKQCAKIVSMLGESTVTTKRPSASRKRKLEA